MRQIPVDTSTAVDLTALVAKALVPYNLKPSQQEIEVLLDGLTRCGEQLLGDVVRLGKTDVAAAALEDWHTLTCRGPEDSPLGAWNHARALARVIKVFRRAVDQAS
ncbi:DUF6415 family natural product biosynthesis protein [Streptomyces sp. APSN-46.1]|uniref:DUF6415 family natural product biosynthesis protein n=1 Tax=Streptomyces sp. APSN-46.1 TaxID=2929049 RepID=UPI001FB2645D|nr:DUF6415 family natural product biosynthesis protein [Streptomyces sp. APSN-46.1]MCJ1680563.1 DUF6415 family natural product biosynthesis protein [Streptomyces sp. APSN-46.1]